MAENKTSQTMENEPELTLEQAKEQLVEMGKKRGVLAYEEVADRLSNFVIESDQMDEFYEYLGEQGVEIIGESEDDPKMKEKIGRASCRKGMEKTGVGGAVEREKGAT